MKTVIEGEDRGASCVADMITTKDSIKCSGSDRWAQGKARVEVRSVDSELCYKELSADACRFVVTT